MQWLYCRAKQESRTYLETGMDGNAKFYYSFVKYYKWYQFSGKVDKLL